MNRTLVEMARAMLHDHDVPAVLWGEAVQAACWTRNRLPTRALENVTPFEAFTGRAPRYGHLRTFGCVAWRHIPGKLRNKLESKSMKGILVGYTSESGMYRIYHPQTGRVAVSSDVEFSENEFDFMDMNPLQFVMPSEVPSEIPNPPVIYDEIVVLPGPPPSAPVNVRPVTPIVDTPVDTPTHSREASVVQIEDSDEEGEDVEEPEVQAPVPPEPIPIRARRRVAGIRPEFPVGLSAAHSPCQCPTMGNQMSSRQLRRNYRRRSMTHYRALVAHSFVEPAQYRDAMKAPDSKKWVKAMEAEIASIVSNKVWELVPRPIGKTNVVGTRWVYNVKHGNLYKARFVAKGFTQKWGVDYDETFAPVAKYNSIRTMIAIAAAKRRKLQQMDVKTAFLNSILQETVYGEQPEGFVDPDHPDYVCLFRKSLYGLKQSTRMWYKCIAPVLIEFDFKPCESDHSIFVSNKDGRMTYIALYVDDLLILGDDDEDVAEIKRRLSEHFDMKDLGEAKRFLGIKIEYQQDGSIKIHQGDYIRTLLERHGMQDCNPVSTPLDPSVKLVKATEADATADSTEYASIVGGLMFAGCVTRPDIMCAIGQLSQFNSNPSSRHLMAAKRVLRYLAGTVELGITFVAPPLDPEVFSDANWAGNEDNRRSTTGYIVMFNGGAIVWQSRLQPTVALSTMEAEYMALAEAAKEIAWLRRFLKELNYHGSSSEEPTVLNTDSQGAMALAKNPVSHARSKHIDIRHHFIREAITDKSVWLQYVPTEDMTADSLTKGLGRQKHDRCLMLMGMTMG